MSRNEERINRELREKLTTVNTQNIGKGELKGIIRRLADNFHSAALIEEKKNYLDNKEAEMVKLDYYYEQFVSWADEFDNASAERKRMILCTLFKRITVGKDYRIEVLLDNSYEQFIA